MGTFCLDSSKQLIGAVWLHLLNLGFASLQVRLICKGDPCEWYWVNIMVDTTLGVVAEYFVMRGVSDAITGIFVKRRWGEEQARSWAESGSYIVNGRCNFGKYIKQALLWVLCIVTTMKLLMTIIIFFLSDVLLQLAHYALYFFMESKNVELVVVMILTPTIKHKPSEVHLEAPSTSVGNLYKELSG